MVFKGDGEFGLFRGCVSAGKEATLIEHLDVFKPEIEYGQQT